NERAPRRVVDVTAKFREITGLSLEDFMVLGFAVWALAMQHSLFLESALANTGVQSIKDRLTGVDLEKFYSLFVGDYAQFRSESARRSSPTGKYAKTEFNLLRAMPIIRIQNGYLVAPVPQLVIERAT